LKCYEESIVKNMFLALLAIGCAQRGTLGQVRGEPLQLSSVSMEGLLEPAENDCSRSFWAGPGTEEYVSSAMEHWSAATGCDIHEGEEGVPVLLVPILYHPGDSNNEVWGVAHTNNKEVYLIEVSERGDHPYSTTLHEVGHDLSDADPDETDGHIDTFGIMAAPIVNGLIDEKSLAFICSGLPCKEFNPEN
jgi:hypothetical protein